MDWGKVIGAFTAAIILVCVWIACGKRLIKAINGGEPPNFEQRR